MLLDGAHNPAGVEALVAALAEAFTFEHLAGVVAILGDKDVAGCSSCSNRRWTASW